MTTQETTEDECLFCRSSKTCNENLRIKIKAFRTAFKKFVETGIKPQELDRLLLNADCGTTLSEQSLFGIWAPVLTENSFNFSAQELEEDDHEQEYRASQRALSTTLILRKIFGYFDDNQLLSFRPVCKLWAEEVSALLWIFKTIQTNVQVRLAYDRRENVVGKNGVGGLSTLINVIKKGQDIGTTFPCSNFSLTCPNLLVVPEVVEFLENFGYLIHSLTLEFIDPAPSSNSMNVFNKSDQQDNDTTVPRPPPTYPEIVDSLRNLLFKWVPNLRYFSLTKFPCPQDATFTLLNDDSSLDLPNLEIFHHGDNYSRREAAFEGSRMITREILKVAPNLKHTLGMSNCLQDLVDTGKMNTVKRASVYFGMSDDIPPGSDLPVQSEHCFQLVELQLHYGIYVPRKREGAPVLYYPEGWVSRTKLLNKILQNNKDSLTNIQFQSLHCLKKCGLKLPILTKVKSLEITTDFGTQLHNVRNLTADEFFQIFPKDIDVAKTFPNLAHIHWTIKGIAEQGQAKSFFQPTTLESMTSPLTSVRSLTLTVGGRNNRHYFCLASFLLPNLKNLTVYHREESGSYSKEEGDEKEDFPDIVRLVWEIFPELEKVHLGTYFHEPFSYEFRKDRVSQHMDSAITGLSLAAVKELTGDLEESDEDGDPGHFAGKFDTSQALSETPSIVHMKKLRHLRLSIKNWRLHSPVLSHVAGTYGFGRLKDLAVLIEACCEKSSVIDDPKGFMSPNVRFCQVTSSRMGGFW